MDEDLRFSKPEALEAWLKDKPAEWARVIAFRAAMRVVPVLGATATRHDGKAWLPPLTLAIFRTFLISGNASWMRWSFPEIKAAAGSAAGSAAYSAADSAAYSAARSAAYSAAGSAADSAARSAARSAAYSAAGSAARSAARSAAYSAAGSAADSAAYSAADSAAWRTVSQDATALAKGMSSDTLAMSPLWLGEPAPDWFVEGWRKLTTAPAVLSQGFQPWFEWYAARAGLDGQAPRDIFGPELAKKIALRDEGWWKRDVAAINADIAAWLAEKRAAEAPAASAENYAQAAESAVPPQGPGGFQFGYDPARGKITVAPPASEPQRAAMAADSLEELRDTLTSLSAQLQRSNADPEAAAAINGLLEVLPADLGALRPGRVLARTRLVETSAQAYGAPGAEAELFPGAVARILAAALTARDLLACYPEVRELERERVATDVAHFGVDRAASGAQDLAAAAEQAGDVVDEDAQAALKTVADDIGRATTPQDREALAGDAALVGRNFISATLRDAAKKIMAELGEGGVMIAKGAGPAAVTGITCLLCDFSLHWTGVAFFLGAFGQVKPVLDLGLGILREHAPDAVKEIIKRKLGDWLAGGAP